MRENKWVLKPTPDRKEVSTLSKAINVRDLLGSLLVQRGIRDFEAAKFYFRPQLNQLHDPFTMAGMQVAVERLSKALSKGEKIMIYGDYDVDGTTSVSLFYGFLSLHYKNLMHYIPDRYKEGYGVSQQGIEKAHEESVTLIISIDCGIKATEKINYAKELGIDFIVCDHHEPGPCLPPAIAVLDPKRDDCNYPYKELCGCGVAFKFLQAFCSSQAIPENQLIPFLDLVAIAIASDIVPITGENRILTYFGLHQINNQPRTGIKALLDICGFQKHIGITDIVFGVGPRINAAGRIDHAKDAVDLLLSNNKEEAAAFAELINANNLTRRNLDSSITKEALEMIANKSGTDDAKSNVLFNTNWHKGVIGIVASRCIEHYYKPTIILTSSNGVAAGSARSVEGFDVYKAIDACSEHLIQFGGHKYAAGLTIEVAKIPDFEHAFETAVSNQIAPQQLVPKIEIDLEIEMEAINDRFINILKQMEPFGPGNMRPVFVSRYLKDTGKTRILKSEHLKLELYDKNGIVMGGIAFGMAAHYKYIENGQAIDICYTLEENHFRGQSTIQLMVKDIKPTSVQE